MPLVFQPPISRVLSDDPSAHRVTSSTARRVAGLRRAPRQLGRLAANKRVPVLIEALAHLGDLAPQAHVVLVGDCSDVYQSPDKDLSPRAAAFERKAADLLRRLPER